MFNELAIVLICLGFIAVVSVIVWALTVKIERAHEKNGLMIFGDTKLKDGRHAWVIKCTNCQHIFVHIEHDDRFPAVCPQCHNGNASGSSWTKGNVCE